MPDAVVPLEIMKTMFSTPEVRAVPTPVPEACARLESLPSVLALVMACARLPWPLAFALTTVSKLKPKSTLATP